MPRKSPLKFDEIGEWSEIKLDIVKDYAKEYSKILAAQSKPRLHHVYIDAFAGAGTHIAKSTGSYVLGSPLNALLVEPPFREFFFIDLDQKKTAELKRQTSGRPDVQILTGDCNKLLLEDVFPQVSYSDYKRGLCLLDPYGLHLNWEVIAKAGEARSLEIFLNFPVMAMNRNTLWRNPEQVSQAGLKQMNAFWGDDSWREAAYKKIRTLFEEEEEKEGNEEIAAAFRNRLMKVAGFKNVPAPLPMKNSKGAVVYYLFFASQNNTGNKIVEHIFGKYR
jgi:three-Cys-motif partner protein